jgi:hypothetical protein
MVTHHTCRRTLSALALAALAACGAAGDNPMTTPSSIVVALSASTASATQGASTPATITITVTRTNFTGDVQLTAESLPSGVTAAFSPATLSGSSTSSVVSLSAATGATPASTSITVRAKGTGVTDATSSLSLTVLPAPAYTMSLASASASIAQSATGTVNVTLARTNFTGAVSFAVSGAPSGATVSVAPSPTTADAAVLTINTGTAAAGSATLTVTGSAAGLTDRTATLALTVTSAASYTLTTTASTLSVVQGASGAVVAGVARTNFSGDVNLAVTGLPSGATASFNPNPVTSSAATSTLTIATGTAAPGTYPLTITGTATGLANRTAALALTITASTAATNVVFTFCAPMLPVWVGYQSGTSGAWTTASVGAGNSYSFNITGVGGVAYVVAANGDAASYGYETWIQYGTAAELQSYGGGMCPSTATGKTVYGQVLGMSPAEEVFVGLGYSRTATSVGPYILTNVADGAHDLVASRHAIGGSALPNKVIISRGLNPAAGSTLPSIDFGTSGVATAAATLTVSGLGATPASVDVGFDTQNETSAALTATTTSGAGTAAYYGVPDSSLIAGDRHSFTLSVMDAQDARYLFTNYQHVANRTIAMSPVIATPAFTTVATAPYARINASFASQTAYNGSVFLAYGQQHSLTSYTGSDRYLYLSVTAGYLGGAPATWSVSIPDLSGAAGFNSSWGLSGSFDTYYYLFAFGDVPGNFGADGATFALGARNGSFTSSASMSAARQRLAVAPSRLSAAQRAAKQDHLLRAANPRVYRLLSRFR